MNKLIKGGKVYSPEYLGVKDILIVGDKIVKISENIDISNSLLDIEVIDAEGKIVVPGFIDQHVHIIGGGGEAGFHSRTPEVMLSKVIESGITTLVGLLGTDGCTRQVESLLAKAKGLETEGISTYIHTGSYEIPSVTLTGSVKRDIMFIDKVIGVKMALSDHRSSHITEQELIRLASDARVAGMLSNKAGLVVMHIGDAKEKLDMVMKIVKETDIPVKHFCPTHVNRNRALFEQAMEFAKIGGSIDLTAGTAASANDTRGVKSSKAVAECIKNNVPIENITMSSDGNGSTSEYDSRGNIIKLGASSLNTLHLELKDMIKEEALDMSTALKVITSNVAKVLGVYPVKGYIDIHSDADIVLMDKELNIHSVIAKGRMMMENGEIIVKGSFE
ncbi:MAG: beta-aspartyl-peptidase [Clostridium sp.]|uniref:beta-aspartyl-peptidase n=1 Tax=Clostridium sp. TaxID=1506 RepID=UPI003061AE47